MEEIDIKARTEQAVKNFKDGYNCTQSVALAYADLYPVDIETVKMLAAPFGGGMGRLREVCGAVSGMFLILGMEKPVELNDKATKAATYAAVQSTALHFKERMGSYICADLLKIGRQPQDSTPEDRNSEYYAKRPCAYCVAVAAEILGEELIKSRDLEKTD
ncbi:MAG: C-GCAxxG-C-C family protein [Bacteroidales bacterium]|nr:C-GCAxxG-C-C family protein [Bacteroidales bacterium]